MIPLALKDNDDNLPDNFLQLQKELMPLKPITSKKDYKKAMTIVECLVSMEKLTTAQQQYLEVLSNNIAFYEKDIVKLGNTEPISTLKFLLEQNNLNASDLGRILGNRTLGPAIISGKRALSKSNIKTLADHFSVSPAIFF